MKILLSVLLLVLSTSAFSQVKRYNELFLDAGKVLTELDDQRDKLYDYKKTKSNGQHVTLALFVNKVDVTVDGQETYTYMKITEYEVAATGQVHEKGACYLTKDEFVKVVTLLDELLNGCNYDKIGFVASEKKTISIWGNCKKFYVRFFPEFKQFDYHTKAELKKIVDVLKSHMGD